MGMLRALAEAVKHTVLLWGVSGHSVIATLYGRTRKSGVRPWLGACAQSANVMGRAATWAVGCSAESSG